MIDRPNNTISKISLPSRWSFHSRSGLSFISHARFRSIVSMGKVGIGLLPRWWPWWSSSISKGTKESSGGRRSTGIGCSYNSTRCKCEFSIRSQATGWRSRSISICGSFISQPTPYSLYSIADHVVKPPITMVYLVKAVIVANPIQWWPLPNHDIKIKGGLQR